MTNTILHDNLWLCEDCHMAASGADITIVDQVQAKATEDGLARLAEDGHLVPDGNGETGDGCDVLMSARCNCCNVLHVHGLHNRYAILGEDPKPNYLDPSRIIDKRQSDVPTTYHCSQLGYGNRIPTTWELRLDDGRWRRVYARVVAAMNAQQATIVKLGNAGSTGTTCCVCGHAVGEHGNDPEYPGSTACQECPPDGCIAYEADR